VVGARSLRPLKIGDKPLLEIELANHGQGIATDIRIVFLMHVGVPMLEFASKSSFPPQFPLAPEPLLAAGQTRARQLPYFDVIPPLSSNPSDYEGLRFHGFLTYADAAGHSYDGYWCYGVVPSSQVMTNPDSPLTRCNLAIKIKA